MHKSIARTRCAGALLAAFASSLFSLPLSGVTLGADFTIAPGSEGNLVKFTSKAPMESFDGTTSSVLGTISLDPRSIGKEIDLEITVQMATLDTGIGLRNRHMRENHLHTDKYPTAVLRGGTVVNGAGASLAGGGEHTIEIEAEMELHGVTRTILVPLSLAWNSAAGTLSIGSEFALALSDYEIPRPKFLVMKLGDVQRIAVHLFARSAAPPAGRED